MERYESNRGTPRETLVSSSIPSLQSKASNRIIVQTRASSSGNLEGSKFQLSRVSIAWIRISSSITGEVLEKNMMRLRCRGGQVGADSPGSQMIVDRALGLGVHVAQKFCISRASVSGVTSCCWETGGEKCVHGFTDIVFIPASPARAAAMPSSEGESQTTYVDALTSHWSSFIHES